MIRFIINTTSSKTDTNGNRYHFADIVSTRTKNTLQLKDVGGDSNAVFLVRRLIDLDWSEVYATEQTIAKREYQRKTHFRNHAKWEHEVTATDLLNLEKE